MATQGSTFEDIPSLVKQLAPGQKLRLIEVVISNLKESLQQVEEGQKSLRSLYELWKDLGASVIVEDIDEVRQEMWGKFPGEDI